MVNKSLKNKLSLILSTVLFSLFIGLSINGFASEKSSGFSSLEEDVESIIGDNTNYSVFISTKDGDIGIEEEKVYSSASTIKVPILMEALLQGEQGIINLDEKITVSDSDITSGGGIIRHMSANQTLSLRDLLYLMITQSDNTATNMIIERVGMDSVNQTIAEMGAEDTILQRYMMESVRPNDNLTSAKDMATIMQSAFESDILSSENKEEFLRIMGEGILSHYRSDRHKDISNYSKGGSLGSTNVRHNIGMFTYQDEVVYVSVMSEDAELKSSRIVMAEIGERVMDYIVE
ncbi:serine hydrolase [Oceanobacillus kimchii]|uniref:serine hydrolase n=1 Tax=Oceanobacillus kimchii TaxID=746691 RepID=UPI003B02D274